MPPSSTESRAGPKRTLTELRIALARAAEGLPVTLSELLEAFGEEGAADWAEGYEPHCHPRFLRAFAVAVAERLARERKTQPAPPPAPAARTERDVGPLDGLPLLREDWKFVDARTRFRRDRDALLAEYARRWREAADAEPVEIRKSNAGRYAANAWLRGVTR
ncbi:tetratricopeptide TPR_4 [Thioalkalivibrio nitratireducens DSM 14787]|uniref:Tetratricopeptide TPR_4 n=1 Tax=Thioalkalivibrio nitratireducens (strain DSM 14787 / UNIQEM 213 / ALEN2) TaxID=1255043 RepID=L0DXJ4_THIND|nr:hypothetical protein [Thioalkalivibrio nitratireducens]AGA33763.1 tetratricopeptide TPR_4 [Thioalkalivibrio nitratireducens DSM 14787]